MHIAQAPLFLIFEQSLCFLQLEKTRHDFCSSNLVQLDVDLDPDPHSEKLLDPDPNKMNADPQPWIRIRKNECGSTAPTTGVANLVGYGSFCGIGRNGADQQRSWSVD